MGDNYLRQWFFISFEVTSLENAFDNKAQPYASISLAFLQGSLYIGAINFTFCTEILNNREVTGITVTRLMSEKQTHYLLFFIKLYTNIQVLLIMNKMILLTIRDDLLLDQIK